MPKRSVPTSHIGPIRGFLESYGTVLGAVLRFNPSMTCFQCSKSDFLKIIRRTSQAGSPVPRRSVPTSHIGPVRGVRDSYGVCIKGYFTISPFDGMFLCLSLFFYKFTSYTPTGSLGTTPFVLTSHIGPVRCVRDAYGTVLRLFNIFTLRWHVFMLKSNFLQLYVV